MRIGRIRELIFRISPNRHHSAILRHSRLRRNSLLRKNSLLKKNSRGDGGATAGSLARGRLPGASDGNGLQNRPVPIDRGIGPWLRRWMITAHVGRLRHPWSPPVVGVMEAIGSPPLLDGMPDTGS